MHWRQLQKQAGAGTLSCCFAGSKKAAESHRGGAYGRAGGQASLLSDDENSGKGSGPNLVLPLALQNFFLDQDDTVQVCSLSHLQSFPLVQHSVVC